MAQTQPKATFEGPRAGTLAATKLPNMGHHLSLALMPHDNILSRSQELRCSTREVDITCPK